jgi:Pectate lyase superfamily protein
MAFDQAHKAGRTDMDRRTLIKGSFGALSLPMLYRPEYARSSVATDIIPDKVFDHSPVGLSVSNEDNSTALQIAVDRLAQSGGGQITLPPGTFLHSRSLEMRTGVNIVGAGAASSFLHYTGSDVAINGIGTSSSRKLFQLRDLCLLGTRAAPSATAIKLAWNQRSIPLLQRVRISDFGNCGILFAGNNWLITFRDIEIHDCAKRSVGSAGISRLKSIKDIQSLADIKIAGLVIENCGMESSSAGAISLLAEPTNPTQGFWVSDATIEGNFGESECTFEHSDLVSFTDSYFEISNLIKRCRNAIMLNNARLNLIGCRLSSDPNNICGAALICRSSATTFLSGNVWDSDFRAADIICDPTSKAFGPDMLLAGTVKVRLKIVSS